MQHIKLKHRWIYASMGKNSKNHNPFGHGGSVVGSVPSVWRFVGLNPGLAATQGPSASSLPTMLCITIASVPPRRESALLSLACTRKNGNIKDSILFYSHIYIRRHSQ